MSNEITLDDLIDPDAGSISDYKVPQDSGNLIIRAMVQNNEVARYVFNAGLKPEHFSEYMAQITTCRIVYDCIRDGLPLPSQSYLTDMLGVDPAFFKSIPDQDLVHIKKLVAIHAERSAVKIAMSQLVDDLDMTKFYEAVEKAKMFSKPKKTRTAFFIEEVLNLPDSEPLINQHLMRNCFGLVYGASGVGKSFYSIDMALSVANGTKFLDRWDTSQGNVCYVLAEGQGGLKKRLKSWLTVRKRDINKNICFLLEGYNLTDPNEAEEIMRTATSKLEVVPDVIFIDTLGRNFTGDENSFKDMSAFVRGCDTFRANGKTAVVIVHHTGKDETRGERGHSCLKAASDTLIKLEGNVKSCKVHNDKQKDGEPFRPYTVKCELDAHSLTLRVATEDEVIEENETALKILNCLPAFDSEIAVTEAGTKTMKELIKDLDIKERTAYRIIDDLTKAGKVHKTKFGKGSSVPFKFFLLSC